MLHVIGAFCADATPVKLRPQAAIAAPSAAAAARNLYLNIVALPWGINEGAHAASAQAPSADRPPRARATHPPAPLARRTAHFVDTGTHRGAFLGVPASGRSVSTQEFAFYR